ncbi:MAG: cupredoxin domain-containing protein [Nitrosotalea sp.]
MKTIHLAIIIGSIGVAAAILAIVTFDQNTSHAPLDTSQTNNMTQSISTVVIPKGSEDQSAGKNYEPQYLVVVLGVNNTVRWTNEAADGNSIVANNNDDPDFANATQLQSTGYMHLMLANFLNPGKSFTYTFTKAGEFEYHGEPHPWLHGSVLVLPNSAQNAIKTVVLNDNSNISNPCEVFAIPCPLNHSHTFTAQKLGANIYIEKLTGNGVDYYGIIHNSRACNFSTNFGGSCSNPDDLAILRFLGVDTSVPQQQADISITGLHLQYLAGEPVDFGIRIQGYGPCDFPSISVTHGGGIVWKSKPGAVSCPFPMVRLSEEYDLDSLGGPLYFNQTGTYTVQVEYDSNMTEQGFNVVFQGGSSAIPLVYTNGTYTGFSIDYGIAGHNKLLGATLDNNTITLSTHTTEDGNLTVTLTPELASLVVHGKNENMPIVLDDGQEVKYAEHLSNQSMIMTIPFHGGVKKIEIAATEII